MAAQYGRINFFSVQKENAERGRKMAGREEAHRAELDEIYKAYKDKIAEIEKSEKSMELTDVIELGVDLQEDMGKLNIRYGFWDDSRGYDHDAIYFTAEFLYNNCHIRYNVQLGCRNPDSASAKAALGELIFQAVDRKKKKKIHVIEPYPGDMLGSASGICYSPGISLVLHTMCAAKDEKKRVSLKEEGCRQYKKIRKKLNVDKHFGYQLEDCSGVEGMNNKEEDFEILEYRYEEKYGKENLCRLVECVKEIIGIAKKEGDYIAFPLGIEHPMYRLAVYECIKQIKQIGFNTNQIIVYVEHPYDYQNVGTGRIQRAKEYIQSALDLKLCRCDDLSADQSVLKSIVREVYGKEKYESMDGTLERTFCSYFVNDEAVQDIKQFLNIHVNNILFITTQAKPFLKTGGMGEVAYALCKTLKDFVNDIRIMMPRYPESMGFCNDGGSKQKKKWEFDYWGNENTVGNLHCEMIKKEYDGLVYYLLDMGELFNEGNLSDVRNEGKLFAVFCDAVIGKGLHTIDYTPSILHCNDWQTALIPMLKKTKYHYYLPELKVVYTIHFYGYKGVFQKEDILEYVGLKSEKCRLCISCDSDCPFDNMNFLSREDAGRLGIRPSRMSFMKTGIKFADMVTTVSKGYAKELQRHPDFADIRVTGIRNGISQREYRFAESSGFCEINSNHFHELKKKNKDNLQKKMGLERNSSIPLICIVSRLTADKGMDVIKSIIKEIMEIPAQLVIIGDDNDKLIHPYESFFRLVEGETENKGRFAYRNYSEELEYETYAGADMVLMPSLKETCGTTQMNAMQYGVVPIVSMIDSFNDTVLDFKDRDKREELPYRDKGTGFYAYKGDCWVLLEVIKKAVTIYRNKDGKGVWDEIVQDCMKADFGWRNKSIKEYLMLYNTL